MKNAARLIINVKSSLEFEQGIWSIVSDLVTTNGILSAVYGRMMDD